MNQLLRAVAAAVDRTLWLIDAAGRQVEPSESWCAFTGQSAAAAAGAGWLDAIHPDERAAVSALWREARPAPLECRVLRPNGKHTRAQLTAVEADPGTRVCALSEVWADATVRRSEERLRLATQAANVAIWEYDFVAGQMTRTDNHDALYGLPPTGVWTYDAFTSATHPDDRGAANQAVQTSVVPGGPDHYAMDFRVVWPDGAVHWLACTGDVVRRDREGRAELVRGTLTDVTRLKAVEAELREAIRVRDDFLQVASHELNTPLTPLGLKLERLKRRGPSGSVEEFQRDLEVARSQFHRISALVNELLDVTRMAEGRLELSRTGVELGALVRRVAEALAGQHGVVISVEGEPELWCDGDAVRVEQILENLLSNALKYGRGHPVQVVLGREAGLASVQVIDRGIGIEPDALERIFQKFERAPSARNISGLGLGLYIVKQLVEQHRGQVRVQSRLGEGSTFTVLLPQAAGATAE
ncbi:MAG: PAS domain-containing protein [Archangiaceae bacterium]|nr:PAS domain-containing protein [Archangiaceae bacterium]